MEPLTRRTPAFARRVATLLALALAACGGGPDPGPEAVARDFLYRLAEGRTSEAWAMTAFLFQAASSEPVFARAAKDYRIRDAVDFQIAPVSEAPQRARFEGTYKTADAIAVPFEIEVALERGRWKVLKFAVRLGPGAPKIEAFSALADLEGLRPPDDQPVPGEAELRELARRALADFADAVAAADFTAFYEKTSEIWRAQTSPARLASTFDAFIQQRVDLRDDVQTAPELTEPPDVDRKGILRLKGGFSAGEGNVIFELRFRYELPRWRLFGLAITVDTAKRGAERAGAPGTDGPGAAPSTAE